MEKALSIEQEDRITAAQEQDVWQAIMYVETHMGIDGQDAMGA